LGEKRKKERERDKGGGEIKLKGVRIRLLPSQVKGNFANKQNHMYVFYQK